MAKFYDYVENGDIKNDSDLRIAIYNKLYRTWNIFATVANNNRELFDVLEFKNGLEPYENYKDKDALLDFHISIDALRGAIINNLCASLGKGRNDTLSIINNKHIYDEEAIDEFYKSYDTELNSMFKARNKLYAHIDANVDSSAFYYDTNFLRECIIFLNRILSKGAKK